jgi:hypothetical protein
MFCKCRTPGDIFFEEKCCKELFLLQPLEGWTKDDDDDDDNDVALAVYKQQH